MRDDVVVTVRPRDPAGGRCRFFYGRRAPYVDGTERRDLSYGVYNYGWPASRTLVSPLPGIEAGSLAAASLVAASVIGWMSWTYVEQPSLRARGPLMRWIDRRPTRVGAGSECEAVAS